MTDWLESVKDIVSLVADSKAILGVGGLALVSGSVAGAIPRVGLGRALSLGFKSYFKTTYPLSVRKSDIMELSDSIQWMGKGRYIIVTGGKGMGKTCMIDTTLNRHLGAVQISVSCLSFILYCVCEFSGKYVAVYRLNLELQKVLSLIRHFAHLLEYDMTF